MTGFDIYKMDNKAIIRRVDELGVQRLRDCERVYDISTLCLLPPDPDTSPRTGMS